MAIKIDWVHSIRFAPELEMQVEDIDIKSNEFFENIFAGYDDYKTVCTLRFVSSEEMKKHESTIDYTTRDTCIKLIKDLLEKMVEEIERGCDCIYAVLRALERLLDALEVDKERRNQQSAQCVKGCIKSLEDAISHVKECKSERCKNRKSILRKISELMEELDALQFPGYYSLLGCYYRTYSGIKDLIFICPENILRASERENIGFAGLLFSVVVHEYAHFVDANTALHEIPMSKKEEVLYSALQETIAQTIQKLYIDQYIDVKWKSKALQKWINKDSASGNFPGWGYAGANILAKAENKRKNRSLEDILIKVIDISRRDWKAGYHFINSLKILEKM